MRIQHRRNFDATPIDEGHREKYKANNKKSTKPKTTKRLAYTSTPYEGTPARSKAHRAPSPISIPEAEQLSEAPSLPQSFGLLRDLNGRWGWIGRRRTTSQESEGIRADRVASKIPVAGRKGHDYGISSCTFQHAFVGIQKAAIGDDISKR